MELSEQERVFGVEVKRRRLELGFTQLEVARRINLARSKVSEMCSGSYLPNREVLDQLIDVLKLDREPTIQRWEQAQVGQRRRRHAERMARDPAPEGWARPGVLSPEVRSLLRAQIEVARDLPYQLPGARQPSLATVYVQQALGSGLEEPRREQPRPEPVLDDHGRLLPVAPAVRIVVRQPSQPLRQALDSHEHLLITGAAGQGKSTMTLRLAAEIADAWMDPPADGLAPLHEVVVPLRLTARGLASRLDLPFRQALAECVRSEYGRLVDTDLGPHVFAERVIGCRWLLLIDGLDEIADGTRRSRLARTLSGWARNDACPYRVLLTTRPIEGTALAPMQHAGVPRYELRPFDEEALRLFAQNWFGDHDTAHRFVWQRRADGSARSLPQGAPGLRQWRWATNR